MHKIAFVIIAASGFVASADIVRVDEFNSLQFEGFNDLDMGVFEQGAVDVFGGMGQVLNSNGSWLHSTSSWSWKNRAQAFEGSKMLGNAYGGIEYQFNTAQKSFGGFFASIVDTPNANINFFDGDTLVGSDQLIAEVGGDWSWNGWSSALEFDRVVVEGNYGNNGGGLMHDAVRILTTQVPTTSSLTILAAGLVIGARRRR